MTVTAPTMSAPGAVETGFADPYDDTNPLGHAGLAAAEERGEVAEAAELHLDRCKLNAAYVPRSEGGRLVGVDELQRVLRPIFRRSASLGLGHGLTSLMAAVNVWCSGDAAQRRRTAALLLRGERLAVAYHELAHGNDLSRNDLRAVPTTRGVTLHGAKEVINNAGRARGAVVFARQEHGSGLTPTSFLLDDLDALPADRFRRTARFPTVGMVGCRLGGLAFDHCPLPDGAVLGSAGDATTIALRSFQITRCVSASTATAMLEGALFAGHLFSHERQLYGRRLRDLSHARSLLAGAYADLLVAQATVRTAARALHVVPETAGRYAAAAKYLVPRLVEEALEDLAVLLGARSFLRDGPFAIVGRHLRDIAGVGIGHAGGVSCQLALLPDLPRLDPTPADDATLEALAGDSALPDLEPARLRVRAARADPVLATLLDGPFGVDDRSAARVRALQERARALSGTDRGIAPRPAALALTEQYAWLFAEASTRAATRGPHGDDDRTVALLNRIAHRRGADPRASDPGDDELLVAEMDERSAAGLSFDLEPEAVVRPRC